MVTGWGWEREKGEGLEGKNALRHFGGRGRRGSGGVSILGYNDAMSRRASRCGGGVMIPELAEVYMISGAPP